MNNCQDYEFQWYIKELLSDYENKCKKYFTSYDNKKETEANNILTLRDNLNEILKTNNILNKFNSIIFDSEFLNAYFSPELITYELFLVKINTFLQNLDETLIHLQNVDEMINKYEKYLKYYKCFEILKCESDKLKVLNNQLDCQWQYNFIENDLKNEIREKIYNRVKSKVEEEEKNKLYSSLRNNKEWIEKQYIETAKKLKSEIEMQVNKLYKETYTKQFEKELRDGVKNEVEKELCSQIKKLIKYDEVIEFIRKIHFDVKNHKDEIVYSLKDSMRKEISDNLKLQVQEEEYHKLLTDLRNDSEWKKNKIYEIEEEVKIDVQLQFDKFYRKKYEEQCRKEIRDTVRKDIENDLLSQIKDSIKYDDVIELITRLNFEVENNKNKISIEIENALREEIRENIYESIRNQVEKELREKYYKRLAPEIENDVRRELKNNIATGNTKPPLKISGKQINNDTSQKTINAVSEKKILEIYNNWKDSCILSQSIKPFIEKKFIFAEIMYLNDKLIIKKSSLTSLLVVYDLQPEYLVFPNVNVQIIENLRIYYEFSYFGQVGRFYDYKINKPCIISNNKIIKGDMIIR